ncbi:hypothetical protein [Exiguobacterium sp. S22-S28]|uniref:hypothetical protein n=1 Tax=Exiguobacterium sp. S22-S28 TaxID=3342768 RepID=UPI00372D1810
MIILEILSLKLGKYKKLNEFEINFNDLEYVKSKNENNRGLLGSENINIAFLIGENGSGKSSYLEILTIIFSRLLLNQDIGFSFQLVYKIHNEDENQIVKLDNLDKSEIEFSIYNKKSSIFEVQEESFYSKTELHPKRIISISSGPHSNFEKLLIYLPTRNISEKIFDLKGNESTESKLNKSLYEDLLFNPKILNFNSDSLIYIFISLMFFLPDLKSIKLNLSDEIHKESEQSETTEEDEKLRKKIEEEINKIKDKFDENIKKLKKDLNFFEEIGFSLKIKKSKLKKFEKNINENADIGELPQKFLSLFYKLLKIGQPDIIHSGADYTYYFDKKKLKTLQNELNDNEINSLSILTTLMIAERLAIIESSTAYIKVGDKDSDLLTHKIFSDGEWYWLCKMGIIILIQSGFEDNFLVIFDEPDVFLNEAWIEDFVYNINIFSDFNGTLQPIKHHDYMIATHSTLMLTDAIQSQVYKFEQIDNNFIGNNIDFSTFGADRSVISSKLFLNDKRTGNFVEEKINDVFKFRDSKKINNLLNQLGQGYDRFLVQELKLEIDTKLGGDF